MTTYQVVILSGDGFQLVEVEANRVDETDGYLSFYDEKNYEVSTFRNYDWYGRADSTEIVPQ